jgi:hypothetical protein
LPDQPPAGDATTVPPSSLEGAPDTLRGAPEDASADAPADAPKVFDEAYVAKLRDENSKHRRDKKALVDRLLDSTVASAATDLADPADLLVYVNRADLLGEDGLPDPDLIAAAQEALLARKPHLRSRQARGDIDQGGRGQQVETFSFNDWLRSAAR